LQSDPACADITTPHFLQKAGPAASTPTVCPNGYRPGGSTNNNDPKSTPASDASTPNKATSANDDEHPTPHEQPSARAEPLVELCSELRDIRERDVVDGSDRNRTAEAAGPEGAA
jgi:hypothetical protein